MGLPWQCVRLLQGAGLTPGQATKVLHVCIMAKQNKAKIKNMFTKRLVHEHFIVTLFITAEN